jgi:hypothetical protein
LTERRKFERLPVQLSVEVRSRGLGSVCQTADVSRHGLFLATPTPARERQLLILRIPLPDGGHPIDVMASVARAIPEDQASERSLKAGMGVNFFALTEENKERWESFLASLRGVEPPKPQAQGNNRPTFLLQPKDHERLRLFEARELALGSMFLRTPVLRRVGESLRLVLLHPVSDEEFPLLAQVVRVSDGSGTEPKGMVLDFKALEYSQRTAFHDFVEQGKGVLTEPPPSVVDAVRGLPDEPLGQHPALADAVRPKPPEPPRFSDPTPPPSVAPAAVEPPEVAPAEAAAPPVVFTGPADPVPVVAPETSAAKVEVRPSARIATPKPGDLRELNGFHAPNAAPASSGTASPPPAAVSEVPAPRPTIDIEVAPPGSSDNYAELRAALMAKPDDVSLLFRLGSALSKEQLHAAEAVALLTRLLALEPQHALAHGALAWAYLQLGQRTDARLHMSRLRRLGMTIDPALEQMVG